MSATASTITIATCVKNERPYLLEWIAHYVWLGCDQIIVSDNDSTDGSSTTLARLAEGGVITLRRQPDAAGVVPQKEAFAASLAAARHDWFSLIDADELLFLEGGGPIGRYLAGFGDEVTQIRINWLVYGSGGAKKHRRGLMVERFRRSAPLACRSGRLFKSISRTKAIEGFGVHHPRMAAGSVYVQADGAPVGDEAVISTKTVEIAQHGARLHHYAVKSAAEYVAKRARGAGDRTADDPRKLDRYDDAWFRKYNRNSRPAEPDPRYMAEIRGVLRSLISRLSLRDQLYYRYRYRLPF